MFLSDRSLLYADALEGSGTLLSVVDIKGSKLALKAQTLTKTQLRWEPYSGWLWQSFAAHHLVPLDSAHFGLLSGTEGIQVFENTGTLKQISRTELETGGGSMLDAVATGDGQIWACLFGIQHFALNAQGTIDQFAKLELPPGHALSCHSLAVGPDGKTVYAATPDGIVRFVSAGAEMPAATVFLPGKSALALSASSDFLAVQRAGSLDAFGDLEIHRLDNGEQVAVYSQTPDEAPFGVALLGGQLITAFDTRTAASASHEQALRWSELSQLPTSARSELPLRARAQATEDWLPQVARLSSRGQYLLTQPWRRTFSWSSDQNALRELTGPGQGTIQRVVGIDQVTAVAGGPYATQRLSIAASGIAFDSGGITSSASTARRIQLILPPDGNASFTARAPSFEQSSSLETVGLSRATASGIEPLGELTLALGPARLLLRGRDLFQVAPLGSNSFTIAQYPLSEASVGGSRPLAPARTWTVTFDVPVGLTQRDEFEVDVEPGRSQAVIVERRRAASEPAESGQELALWLDLSASEARVQAYAQRTGKLGVFRVALRGAQFVLFEGESVVLYGLEARTFVQRAELGLPGIAVREVLGDDRSGHLYFATESTETIAGVVRDEVLVFDWKDLTWRARFPVPAPAISLDAAGEQLVLATKGSVHTVTPTCGAVLAQAPMDWPVPPDPEKPPLQEQCKPLPGACQSWTPPVQPGDVDRNGCVDQADLDIVVRCFGETVDPSPRACWRI